MAFSRKPTASSLTRQTQIQSIPEPEADDFKARVKEAVEQILGQTGDPLDRAVTLRDLWQSGIADITINGAALQPSLNAASNTPLVPRGDGTGVWGPPTAPADVSAYGTMANIIVTWDSVTYQGHWRTEVWAAETNDLSNAQLIGTSRSTVFLYALGLTGETRYIWVRHINKSSTAGPWHAGPQDGAEVTTGHVSGNNIADGTVTSDKIVSIVADQIVAENLAAISADMGTLTAGKIQSPDQTFEIDLEDKYIRIAGSGGAAEDNYVDITLGDIQYYRYQAGLGHIAYKSLKRVESGQANNLDTVYIPGYWVTPPKVTVSPLSLSVYKALYTAQDQTLLCEPRNLEEYSTGQYRFQAYASLTLSGNSITVPVNYTTQGSGDLTSSTQTTPANTTSLTVNISALSVRGTGTNPNYYYRHCSWRVAYKQIGAVSWSYSSYRTIYFGTNITNQVGDSVTLSLAAGQYQFYVEYTYGDAGGTFASGAIQYDYSQASVAAAAEVAGVAVLSVGYPCGGSSGPVNKSSTHSLPAYSPPSGWEVYSVAYQYDASFRLRAVRGSFDVTNSIGLNGTYSGPAVGGSIGPLTGTAPDQTIAYATKYFNGSSYNPSAIAMAVSVTRTYCTGWSGTLYMHAFTKNASATIYIRKPQANSATAANVSALSSYSYNLSSAAVLASGSLNWIAVGD